MIQRTWNSDGCRSRTLALSPLPLKPWEAQARVPSFKPSLGPRGHEECQSCCSWRAWTVSTALTGKGVKLARLMHLEVLEFYKSGSIFFWALLRKQNLGNQRNTRSGQQRFCRSRGSSLQASCQEGQWSLIVPREVLHTPILNFLWCQCGILPSRKNK